MSARRARGGYAGPVLRPEQHAASAADNLGGIDHGRRAGVYARTDGRPVRNAASTSPRSPLVGEGFGPELGNGDDPQGATAPAPRGWSPARRATGARGRARSRPR